jgi:hypothetical protein
MRYELRTRFTVDTAELVKGDVINTSDKLLRWLYEYLPTRATLGADLARPRWLGGRYNERPVTFELVTSYRDVFAATADQLRIVEAVRTMPRPVRPAVKDLEFRVLRIFGDAELVDWADPTKPKVSIP